MEVATETVTFVAKKSDLLIARQNIEKLAEALGLHLDTIVEKPRRLGIELDATVTGEIKQIESLRTELGGDGFSSSAYNPQDIPIAWLLWWLSNRLGRWRRAQARRTASQ